MLNKILAYPVHLCRRAQHLDATPYHHVQPLCAHPNPRSHLCLPQLLLPQQQVLSERRHVCLQPRLLHLSLGKVRLLLGAQALQLLQLLQQVALTALSTGLGDLQPLLEVCGGQSQQQRCTGRLSSVSDTLQFAVP